jgi:hypothetical protein
MSWLNWVRLQPAGASPRDAGSESSGGTSSAVWTSPTPGFLGGNHARPLHVFQTSSSSARLLASTLTMIPTLCVPIYVLLLLIWLWFLDVSRSGARLS